MVILGTEHGVYVGKEHQASSFTLRLDLPKVTAVDYIADLELVFVLTDQTLLYYPASVLEDGLSTDGGERSSSIHTSSSSKGRPLGHNVSFFRVGQNFNRWFILVVKTRRLTTYIKVYESVVCRDPGHRRNIGRVFDRLARFNTIERFDLYKELYIPAESKCAHFLKTKVIVGSSRGFEIIDLLTLRTQALLDAADSSLAFATSMESCTPLSLFRLPGDLFLVACAEFGVIVDRLGCNAYPPLNQPHFAWVSVPHAFYYHEPYIIGMSTHMVEIWDVTKLSLVQVIRMTDCKSVDTSSTMNEPFFLSEDGTSLAPVRYEAVRQQSSVNGPSSERQLFVMKLIKAKPRP